MSWQWFVNGDPIGSSEVVSWDFDVNTHNILLTVTDDEGETGAIGATIIVTEGTMDPLARFDIDCAGVVGVENDTIPLSVFPGEVKTCSFDAARSFDPDGGSIVSWQWFVNGDPIGSSEVVSWDFDVNTHNILLTVTDDEGETGAIGATIIVTEGTMDPLARFDIDCAGVVGVENDTIPLSVFPGEVKTCSFDAARSFDPDGGSIVSWQWFSNGDPIGSSQVVSWDFDVNTHNILLTVTDDEGETGAIGATIIVTEGTERPEAHFDVSCGGYFGVEGDTISLIVSPGAAWPCRLDAARSSIRMAAAL